MSRATVALSRQAKDRSRRVVSLLPAATEMVFALGRGSWLVGRSHECDYPPEVTALPVVTSTRIDPHADARTIDHQVQESLRKALSLYEVDTERLRALAPDVVLTQDVCQVCGVSPRVLTEALGQWLGAGVQLVRLEARSLAGIYEDFVRVGQALDREATAVEQTADLRRAIEQIRWRSQRARYRPRVLCLEWIDPPIAAGHWIPELVQTGGGDPVLAEAGMPGRRVTWPEIVTSRPEALILMPCGFPLERTLRELKHWPRPSEWAQIPAVANGRVYAAEGNAHLNRPGPRIRESAWLLAGLIQPALFAREIPPASVARVSG